MDGIQKHQLLTGAPFPFPRLCAFLPPHPLPFLRLPRNLRLSYLFSASIGICQFLSVWETARVTLHFKGGSPTDFDNYRPISVLPCISKIMESFVNTDLRNFAHEVGLII